MAISWDQLRSGQGHGRLTGFVMPASRIRQSIVIADPDDTSEGQAVELPSSDDPDRGAALKIGGYASSSVPTAIAPGNRTNAWFTQNSQLCTIQSQETAYVYDYVRRPTGAHPASLGHTGALIPYIGGIGGWKVKVVGVAIACAVYTSGGTAYFQDDSNNAYYLTRFSGVGQSVFLQCGGLAFFTCATSNNLNVGYDGTATINWTVVYYHGLT